MILPRMQPVRTAIAAGAAALAMTASVHGQGEVGVHIGIGSRSILSAGASIPEAVLERSVLPV